jgi:hippurate hydrolase
MAVAEAQAFRAPKDPEITTSNAFPLTSNTEPIDQRILAVHRALLGPEHVVELNTMMASEDFSRYGLPGRHHYDGEHIPYCYWFFGGHSRERYDSAPGDNPIAKLPYLPSNHQSNFAPDLEPTLRGGVSALTSAALAYLSAVDPMLKGPQ